MKPSLLPWLFVLLLLVHVALSGTVIVAKARNGIVLASDSLHSLGSSPLVSAKSMRKFHLLTDKIAIGYVAGGHEFHQLFEQLKAVVAEYEQESGAAMPIAALAHCCRRLMYQQYNKAHVILAGHQISRMPSDSALQGEEGCYRLFELLPQGTLLEPDFIVAGSGGPLIASMFDDFYRPDRVPSTGMRWQGSGSPGGAAVTGPNSKAALNEVLGLCKRALQAVSGYDPHTGGSHCSFWCMTDALGLAGRGIE